MPTYIVTGASSGLGLEMVKQLAARGEKVFATCRKRASSLTGVERISDVPGDVTIIEGVDVADDGVGAVLAAALDGVTIDVVIHNAGSVNGTRAVKGNDIFTEQKLDAISMDTMRAAFEVNTLGPLRVQKALMPQMKAPGGKVAVISTGIGSIGDNGSGGIYAYRTSKAGVNMVTRSMSCDLKAKEISVQAIAPGRVVTEFAIGSEALEKGGAAPVDKAVKTILEVVDAMNMENTGQFIMVPTNGDAPKPFPW